MHLSTPQYIRLCSDLHLNTDIVHQRKLWMPTMLPTDRQTVLIVAGDIWFEDLIFTHDAGAWLENLQRQFMYVVFVLGNHDFWGGRHCDFLKVNIHNVYHSFKSNIAQYSNVFLLQKESLDFGRFKVAGATLWTNYLDGDPVAMDFAMHRENGKLRHLNDAGKYIVSDDHTSETTPKYLLQQHLHDKNFLFSQDKNPEQILIAVSHHAPSFQCMPHWLDTPENQYFKSLYYSDLDKDIVSSNIDYFMFGHTHYAVDFMINNTRILSNPRGGANKSVQFNENWLLNTTSWTTIHK